jgi:hypothetical protein
MHGLDHYTPFPFVSVTLALLATVAALVLASYRSLPNRLLTVFLISVAPGRRMSGLN